MVHIDTSLIHPLSMLRLLRGRRSASECQVMTSSASIRLIYVGFRGRFSRGVRTKFVPVPPELNINGEDLKVVGAALVSGLYPKLLALDSSGGMKTITNQQPVAIVRCFCTYT